MYHEAYFGVNNVIDLGKIVMQREAHGASASSIEPAKFFIASALGNMDSEVPHQPVLRRVGPEQFYLSSNLGLRQLSARQSSDLIASLFVDPNKALALRFSEADLMRGRLVRFRKYEDLKYPSVERYWEMVRNSRSRVLVPGGR